MALFDKRIFTNSALTEIAASHGKSVAAVILRWLNQRGVVVIPKSIRADRICENFNIFDFRLPDAEMAAISALDEKKSPIYDDMDLATVRAIGTYKIHD